MSTTTDILFNSPALHSLKRDQLVKLCKLHSIKASGKNTELIEKLKKHAETLPRDDPLNLATRSEELAGEGLELQDDGNDEENIENDNVSQVAEEDSQSANARWGFQMPRPSEQWEVVMESINEEEERSSQGTLNSIRTIGSNNGSSGEFGTGLSKSSSVSSSIKALASSLGWKRDNASKSTLASSSSFRLASSSKLKSQSSLKADNELVQHSVPYSSLPEPTALPQTDHFTFDHSNLPGIGNVIETLPLPGHTLRPGVPVPANARLSLGLNPPSTPTRQNQPTTTIRLISNPLSGGPDSPYGRTPQLKPFKTNFDLVLGSPGAKHGSFDNVSVWPSNSDEKSIYPPLPLESLSAVASDENMDVQSVPGAFSYITKSPLPVTSPPTTTTQLTVPEPFVFGSPLPQHSVSNAQFKSTAASVIAEMNKRLEADGVAGIGVDLVKKLQPGAHTDIVARLGGNEPKESPGRSGLKEKFDEIHTEEFSKMEGIDSLVRRRAQGGRVGTDGTAALRKGRKSGMGAGRDRFGRRVGGDRTSGRISAANIIGDKKKPRVIPGSFDEDDSDEEGDEAKEKRTTDVLPLVTEGKSTNDVEMENESAKLKEDERKCKEKEAIRRQLELNRARRRSSVGRGRVSVGRGGILVKQQPAPKPSRFGFFSSAKSLVQKVWNSGKPASAAPTAAASGIPKPSVKTSNVAPKQPPPASKKAPAPSRPSGAPRPVSRVSSLRVDKDKTTRTVTSTTSRSPLPSFGPSSSTRSSLSTGKVRGSSITRTSTSAVSSVGTRSSSSTSSSKTGSIGNVGSMGLKKPSANTSTCSRSTVASGSSSSSRLSSRLSSSRLLAPTASSLAKATRPSGSNLKAVAEASQTQHTQTQSSVALGMITNNPTVPGPWSPRRGGIFSQPLTTLSGIPSPVKKQYAEAPARRFEQGGSVTTGTTTTMGLAPARQRSITGRKPRISRSKVIAKLASQRAAGVGGPSGPIAAASGISTSSSRGAGRTRSSLGAKVLQRSSLGGKVGGGKTVADGALLSAKKRARQSEHARRRSRVAPINYGANTTANANDMELDVA